MKTGRPQRGARMVWGVPRPHLGRSSDPDPLPALWSGGSHSRSRRALLWATWATAHGAPAMGWATGAQHVGHPRARPPPPVLKLSLLAQKAQETHRALT